MKLARFGLISLVALFIVITLIGLLFPATVIVSRATDIVAPKDSIHAMIKDLNGWKHWVAGMNDSSVQLESPVKGTLGNTTVVITNVTDSTVKTTWTNKEGNVQTATINLFKYPGRMETVVQWEFRQHLKWYPWERFGSMMNDKILGTMMETNLNNLKTLLEKH